MDLNKFSFEKEFRESSKIEHEVVDKKQVSSRCASYFSLRKAMTNIRTMHR